MLYPSRPTSKPIQGTPLDRARGLARGLAFFAPLWEGSGGQAVDCVGGVPMTFFGSPSWSAGPSGLAVQCNAAGAYLSGLLPTTSPLSGLSWPMTIAVGMRLLAVPSATSLYAGVVSNNATSAIFDVFFTNSTAKLSAGANSAGTGETLGSALTPAAGELVISATVTPSNFWLYEHGAQVYASAQSLSSPTWTGTSYVWLGGEPGYTTGNVQAAFYWMGIWGRALSAGEHAELARNPWQLFAAPSTRVIVGSAPPVGYTLSGPSTVASGVAATFTLTPASATTDTVTPTASPSRGTFSPTSLTWSNSSAAESFTYTNATAGTYAISATSTAGGAISGGPISLTVSAPVGYSLAGPSTGTVGVAATFTVTPASATTDTVALTCSAGGTFSPTSLTWSGSASGQSFTYTNATAGTYALVATSGDGGTVSGSPLSLAVSSASGSARPVRWFPGLSRRFRAR